MDFSICRRGGGFGGGRDSYGAGGPPRDRDRERDSFMGARGSDMGGLRGSDRGPPPGESRGPPPGRGDGGDYGGGRFRRGEDVPPNPRSSEQQSAAPIRQFRAPNREKKENEVS